jgi:nucleoside-diphosphate-sugar epimerase
MAHFLVTGAAGFIGNRVSEMFEELTDKQAQVEHHPAHQTDILVNWADISKAKRLLGWEPQMFLVDGMRHVVEWYRTERAWAKEVATS